MGDLFEVGLDQEERELCFFPEFRKPQREFLFMLIVLQKSAFFESSDLRILSLIQFEGFSEAQGTG